MAVTAMRIANLPELLPRASDPKDEPPPWGKAAAGDVSGQGTDVCAERSGRGGSLSRGRDSGVESLWPTIVGVGSRVWVAGLGGRFAVAFPAPIRDSLGELAADV